MHIHPSQEKEVLDKRISLKFLDFLPVMKPIGPKNAERSVFSIKLAAFFLVECFFVACLFSIYAGSRVPEVNESHYWTKAKHFWDPSFASGDLFLASADEIGRAHV